MTHFRFSTGYDALAQRVVEGANDIGRKHAARAAISETVKAYIERNGVRRFENGASADYVFLKAFLAERGFHLSTIRNQSTFTITTEGQRGRQRCLSWSKVIAFVDNIRKEEGREPLKLRAA